MAGPGAPLGNTYATGNKSVARAKLWKEAIKRALSKRANGSTIDGLDMLANKLVEAADCGDPWALKEIGDRIDGKPAQSVTVDGDGEGGPVQHCVRVEFVDGSVPKET